MQGDTKLTESEDLGSRTMHACSVRSNSVTLRTIGLQAPLSMGFSRQGYWSGLPFPPSGDLPNPGTEPGSPALQVDSLPFEPFITCMTWAHLLTSKLE